MYICLYIYMYNFYWILVIIYIESSKLIIVFNLKRKAQTDIQHIINVLNR
jgi:hypothetical protein